MSEPPRGPAVTVDVIIELDGSRIVLVQRKFSPLGWALPGGFVEVGERLDQAARREAKEETGLEVELVEQLFTYSDPARDPRRHTVATVFIGRAAGEPRGGDDAQQARAFPTDELPSPLCFDHGEILRDYQRYRRTGERRRL